jgi:hypothetical protein
VHRVRERDVDRIDLAEAIVELFVRERLLETISLRHFAPLGPIVADNCDQFRITRVSEGRENRYLSDMPETHYGVSD